jgi:hypothetical protein
MGSADRLRPQPAARRGTSGRRFINMYACRCSWPGRGSTTLSHHEPHQGHIAALELHPGNANSCSACLSCRSSSPPDPSQDRSHDGGQCLLSHFQRARRQPVSRSVRNEMPARCICKTSLGFSGLPVSSSFDHGKRSSTPTRPMSAHPWRLQRPICCQENEDAALSWSQAPLCDAAVATADCW